MARKIQYEDNAETLLTTAVNNTDDPVVFSVTAGDGAKFPALTAGLWFPITIVDASDNFEHMMCTARSTDSFTCDREVSGWGQTKRAFAIGDAVYLGIIKPMVDEFLFKEEQQEGLPNSLGAVSGTNTLTASATPTVAAYVTNQYFLFEAAANNTGAVTIDIDSVGAANLVDLAGNALIADALIAGGHYLIQYDGTNFVLMNGVPGDFSANDVTVTGDLEVTGTMTIANAAIDLFPSGMEIQQFQTTIPSGWDLETTDEDRVPIIRNTNAVGGSQGGGWTITGLSGSQPNHTHAKGTIAVNQTAARWDDASGDFTPPRNNTESVTGSTASDGNEAVTVSAGSSWRPLYTYCWIGSRNA